MTTSTIEELSAEGWPIIEDKIRGCFGSDAFADTLKLRKKMLDADMRDYSISLLAARVDKQAGQFKDPLITQLTKVRNVSYPKYGESTHPDGMLKVQLSDGCSSVQALAIERIPNLSADTPPGTKFKLFGTIKMESGLLMIDASNCCYLGGVVHHLYEKWSVEKDWLQQSVRAGNSSAPKWVKFSKEGASVLSALNANIGGFCSNDYINGAAKTIPIEEASTFSVTRKAQIEQIVEGSAVKSFARSKLRKRTPPLKNAAPASSHKDFPARMNASNTFNKTRSFARGSRRDDASPVAKPSKAPTLLDFMQAAVPELNTDVEDTRCGRSKREENRSPRTQRDIGVKYGRHPREQQYTNTQNKRNYTGSRQAKQRTFATNNLQSDAHWTNNNNRVLNPADFPAVNEVTSAMANMHVDPTRHQGVGAEYSGYLIEQQTNNNSCYTPTQFSNSMENNLVQFWNIGDQCFAPWTDGQFYLSKLVSVGPADMCTVEYVEYGNRSTVPIGALLHVQQF